jgi:hypothetical protein
MAGQYTHSDTCPNNPVSPLGPHMFVVDKEDKNFKICEWCDKTAYRTDEELLKGTV